MITIQPRLYLSNRVAIAPRVLANLTPHALRRFANVNELTGDLTGAVFVATDDEARALLARAEEKCVLVIWAAHDNAHHPPALLAHAAVAGALDVGSSTD